MKNQFAESVYNYFQFKLKETGIPLNEIESQLLAEAKKQMKQYPISFLTEDDFVKLGYKLDNKDRKRLPGIAHRLGEDYREQIFWDSLDELARDLGIERADNCEAMMAEYFNLLNEGKYINSVFVVVQYKNAKLPVTATIALVDGHDKGVNHIMTVNSIMDLQPYFDENNPYDFFIKQYIEFNCDTE